MLPAVEPDVNNMVQKRIDFSLISDTEEQGNIFWSETFVISIMQRTYVCAGWCEQNGSKCGCFYKHVEDQSRANKYHK